MIPSNPADYVPQWKYIWECSDGQQRTGTIYAHQGCEPIQDAQEFCDMLFVGAHMVAGDGSHSFTVLSATPHRIN